MLKTYLKAYNLILCIGWAILFIRFVLMGFTLDSTGLILLNICQLAALLEIGHALLRWVPSPVVTTAIQVSSRVFVLLFVNLLDADSYISFAGVSGLHLIIFAWSLTEIVRYGFYFSQLINLKLKTLLFLRYNLFLVLYPVGVAGELMVLASWFLADGFQLAVEPIIFVFIALLYVAFFPRMYGHMLKQRRKKV